MTHDKPITEHPQADQAVRDFVARAVWLLWLRQTMIWASAWLFVWGVAILVLVHAADINRVWMLAGGLGLAAAAVAAGVRAWRSRPAHGAVIALMDQHNQSGGLLMAGCEQPQAAAAWAGSVGQLSSQPRLAWQAGRTPMIFAAGSAFVLAAMLMPVGMGVPAGSSPLDVSEPVGRLAEQIQLLEQQQLLDPHEAHTLHTELQALNQQAAGHDPVRTWEALDHLRQAVEQAGAQAAEQALSQTSELTRMQTLAGALAQVGDQLDAQQLTQAIAALEDMVLTSAREQAGLSQSLDPSLLEAAAAGRTSELTPQQLTQLAEALDGRKMDIAQMLEQMAEVSMIDPRQVAMAQMLGQGDVQGLCDLMTAGDGDMTLAQMLAMCQGQAGGGTRGGGPAPMTANASPSSAEDTRFEAVILPPASQQALRDSELISLSATSPKEDSQAGPSTPGALGPATASDSSAASHRVLPRHRGAVQRYFQR